MFSWIKDNWAELILWFCAVVILVAFVAERTITIMSIKLDKDKLVCTRTNVVQECVEYRRVKE